MSKPDSLGTPLLAPPKADINIAQRALVHIHDPSPLDSTRVDAEGITPMNVIIN